MQSQFLKHLFDFDVSHEAQISRIITKAESLKAICGPFQRQISDRITMILYERSKYHRATYIANPDSMVDPYPTALLHFYREVQKTEKKAIAYNAELQDVIKRSREQHAVLFEGLLKWGASLIPPMPVEVDLLLRPGTRVTIVWGAGQGELADVDQSSVTAGD
ncbi:MAG: hypothetical protein Q9208_008087, partial [Pyrenodesmia sp. 3 TL-2023]